MERETGPHGQDAPDDGGRFLCRGIVRCGMAAKNLAKKGGGDGERGWRFRLAGCRLPMPVGISPSGQGFEKPLAAFPHIPVGGIKIPCVPRVGYVPILSGKFQQPVKFSRWVARGQPV